MNSRQELSEALVAAGCPVVQAANIAIAAFWPGDSDRRNEAALSALRKVLAEPQTVTAELLEAAVVKWNNGCTYWHEGLVPEVAALHRKRMRNFLEWREAALLASEPTGGTSESVEPVLGVESEPEATAKKPLWGTCEHHAPDIQPGDCETRDCHIDPGVYPFVVALWEAGFKTGSSCQGGGPPHAQYDRVVRFHHADEEYVRRAFEFAKESGMPVWEYRKCYRGEYVDWEILFAPLVWDNPPPISSPLTEALRQEEAEAVQKYFDECDRGVVDLSYGNAVLFGFRAGKARRPEVTPEAVRAYVIAYDTEIQKGTTSRERIRLGIEAAFDVLYGEKAAGGDNGNV